MGDEEAAQKAAEHQAASLHTLGWESGAGAAIWARMVQDELERHEAARARFGEQPDREDWERLHGTALVLVVAIDQVLTFEKRVRRLTGDAELARARERFDAVGPRAEAIRDLVAHLDEYATGRGRRQTGKAQPEITDPYLKTLVWWDDSGTSMINLGDETMNLRGAARSAVELAEVVERVRERHLMRAEREANAALRRRYGLDE
jgi:hypothetical protein